jgi:hypothetical protein
MALSCQCPCGCVFSAEPQQPARLVRCPSCLRVLELPPQSPLDAGRRPSRFYAWLLVGVAFGLLVALGVMVVMLERDINRSSVALASSPDPSISTPPREQIYRTVVPQPKGSLTRSAPATNPADRLPPLSAPVVSRSEPAEPRAGEPFTLMLTDPAGSNRSVRYQFRQGPNEPWQTATDGRVRLERVKPGPLQMEFRVVDSKRRSSPITRRTWSPTIPAARIAHVARLHAGLEFYQEVIFDRQSQGQSFGIDFHDNARFALLSRFRVDKATPDGWLLSQKVVAVRVARALPALEAELNRLLRQTQGLTFHLTIDRAGKVVNFKGNPQAWAVKEAAQVKGLAIMMQATLDADAWKELAGLTFFQPRRPFPAKGEWSEPLQHQWGPLGRWDGRVVYRPAGHAQGLLQYEYRLDLTYRRPDTRDSMLPFQVGAAAFQLVKGGGSILYDADRACVRAAEEEFQVRGALTAEALGVTAPSAMAETQHFQLRIFDQVPGNWRPLLPKP